MSKSAKTKTNETIKLRTEPVIEQANHPIILVL